VKARILPLGEIARRTDTVVLMLSINPTEAAILVDWIHNDPDQPTAVRLMIGYLETIRDGREATDRTYRQDAINTDGRSLPHGPMRGRPEGTARGTHNLPGLHG
jgi:hypothetical protein